MQISSKAIPLPISNIDTDQIIPAKFLKQVDKLGYGKNLFYSWRYLDNGDSNPEFILNQPERSSAQILIAGNNFGCGSSREHAAWAVADYGIKAIISTQFADIFKGNAYNNGILPIELDKTSVDQLMQKSLDSANVTIEIDLESQEVSCDDINLRQTFDIHPFKKQCLMQGMDETEFLINLRPEIQAYENQRSIPV
ncbi:3-isopropylmalate dehydratase small subunit [Ekhidna sp.]|uniref:3-isopropylmalate dehydratase small subunit n=1 Tax=Ekhidna sp. TaxID=2608089 RepID=UPI003BA9F088